MISDYLLGQQDMMKCLEDTLDIVPVPARGIVELYLTAVKRALEVAQKGLLERMLNGAPK
jgi:hypothetical protein